MAEDKFAWSASLTGTSDYVFRGISQTDNDPTIQGSLGATYGMFYAGWWASGLDWTSTGDPTRRSRWTGTAASSRPGVRPRSTSA